MSAHEISGRVVIRPGSGGLPKIVVTTKSSTAEIYLHGAQVTHFQKIGEPPLLFLSGKSQFTPGKAIRGGIPICFPWFGSRANDVAHGFARITDWGLTEARVLSDSAVQVCSCLPETAARTDWPQFKAELTVTVSETLALEFSIQNTDATRDFVFENLFHAYFSIGDISSVSVAGLQKTAFLDQLENFARKIQPAAPLVFKSEVDSIFPDSPSQLEIDDALLRRKIRIKTTGARSTVVWNPWIEKSKRLNDLDEGSFRKFVCVESGNVAEDKITLKPGATSILKAEWSSEPLA